MPVDIEEIPQWLIDAELDEEELRDMLEDPSFDDDDRDSIQTLLDEL